MKRSADRRRTNRFIPLRRVLLAALSVALLTGPAALVLRAADEVPAKTMPPAPPGFQLGGDVGRGATVFAKSCAICHGPEGHGDGRIKSDPPPRDFTDASGMKTTSDWELYQVVRNGGQILGMSPKMLPWRDILDEQEIRDVAAYVRSLGKKKAEPADG